MNILCFSDINWDFLWQRHQQVLTRFPDNWEIIYVQPSFIGLFIEHPLKVFPKRVKKNILVLSIPTFPFFDRFSILRKINNLLIVFWAQLFIKLYNLKNPNIIIYEPRFSCVVGRLNECSVCYKVIDDRMEFAGVPSWIKDNIDFLIDKADIIIVSSQNLFNKLKIKRKNNMFLVGNGVEVEHFKKARENIEIPMDIKSTKKPIIGYIGAIGEWFDFELIDSILKFYPNISIVIIGPIFLKQKPEINKLETSYSNLFVLGKKPYSILPNYIRAFDACIIPFKITELTLSVNPNKLYEYLAAGKPVISTALPEVEKYNGTVYVAKNTDEFLSHIDKVLTSTHDAERFLSIAFENSWDDKAKSIIDLIVKHEREVYG